jgi:hypothetical protein
MSIEGSTQVDEMAPDADGEELKLLLRAPEIRKSENFSHAVLPAKAGRTPSQARISQHSWTFLL